VNVDIISSAAEIRQKWRRQRCAARVRRRSVARQQNENRSVCSVNVRHCHVHHCVRNGPSRNIRGRVQSERCRTTRTRRYTGGRRQRNHPCARRRRWNDRLRARCRNVVIARKNRRGRTMRIEHNRIEPNGWVCLARRWLKVETAHIQRRHCRCKILEARPRNLEGLPSIVRVRCDVNENGTNAAADIIDVKSEVRPVCRTIHFEFNSVERGCSESTAVKVRRSSLET